MQFNFVFVGSMDGIVTCIFNVVFVETAIVEYKAKGKTITFIYKTKRTKPPKASFDNEITFTIDLYLLLISCFDLVLNSGADSTIVWN